MVFRTAAFVFAALAFIGDFVFKKLPPLRGKRLTAKMMCSGSFVLTGVCAAVAAGIGPYSAFMLGGLLLGAVGDFFLDYKEKQYFITGTLFFGMGHVLYIIAILSHSGADILVKPYLGQLAFITAGLAVMSVIVLLLNKIHFRGKYKPVAVYSLVLIVSFLVAFTRGMVALTQGDTAYGICLVVASSLFIVSDTCIAIHVLGKAPLEFFHRMTDALINPTYFPAQALFALSILFV